MYKCCKKVETGKQLPNPWDPTVTYPEKVECGGDATHALVFMSDDGAQYTPICPAHLPEIVEFVERATPEFFLHEYPAGG